MPNCRRRHLTSALGTRFPGGCTTPLIGGVIGLLFMVVLRLQSGFKTQAPLRERSGYRWSLRLHLMGWLGLQNIARACIYIAKNKNCQLFVRVISQVSSCLTVLV